MNEEEKIVLSTELKKIINNINDINTSINNFIDNCSDALIINGNTTYSDTLKEVKTSLNQEKQKITDEILKELE